MNRFVIFACANKRYDNERNSLIHDIFWLTTERWLTKCNHYCAQNINMYHPDYKHVSSRIYTFVTQNIYKVFESYFWDFSLGSKQLWYSGEMYSKHSLPTNWVGSLMNLVYLERLKLIKKRMCVLGFIMVRMTLEEARSTKRRLPLHWLEPREHIYAIHITLLKHFVSPVTILLLPKNNLRQMLYYG